MIPAMERRSDERHALHLATVLERADGEKRLALTRDVSARGARIFVASSRVKVGDPVCASFYLGDKPEPGVAARGRLLRVREISERGLWKSEIAMRFEERVAWPDGLGRAISDRDASP